MKKFNEKFLYLYKFIGACLPIYAFYQLLFLENGLTIAQITILMAIWNIVSMLAELPARIIADKYNRRNLLVFSSVLQSTGFIIWFFADNFWTFALGFVFWGISGAMVSGTEASLIFDNLKFDKNEDKFTEIFGKAEFWAYIGIIVAIISAGVLINFITPATISLISAVICLINAGIALGIREKNYYGEKCEDENSEVIFKEALSFFKTNHFASLLIIFLVVFAGFGNYLDEFDAFLAIDFGRDNFWISVFLVIRFASMAIGDLLAPWFEKKMKSSLSIVYISLIGFVTLGIFSFIYHLFALVLFGLAFMFLAIATVLTTQKLQVSIKEEGRATIMSFVGLVQALMMILISLFYGALTEVVTIQQIYLIFSAFGIIGTLVMLPYMKRYSK